jgi:hypothetical protein
MKVKLLKKIRNKFLIKYSIEADGYKMLYIFHKKRYICVSNRWWGFDSIPDLAFLLTQMDEHKLLKKYWDKKALRQFNRI